MNPLTSISSPASVDSASPLSPQASVPSPLPNSTQMPELCSNTTGPTSQTSVTCEPLEFTRRLGVLTSLRQAFHASLRASLESGWEAQMSGGFGLTPSESFASFDPASVSLKTHQLSLALMMGGPSQESSVNWPSAGMMCCGESFPLLPWVLDTSEEESASLLPTPICNDGKGSDYCYGKDHKKILKLPGKVKAALLPTPTTSAGGAEPVGKTGRKLITVATRMLPTPTTRDYKDSPGMATETADGRKRLDQLPRVIFADASPAPIGGMKLTPEFQCWLMGYPPDWLRPLRDALATASSRKPSSRSSKHSEVK